jgi:hypothetical protein
LSNPSGESKNDVLLKRIQITIAILAGLATLIVGIYNVRKNLFAGNGNIIAMVRSDKGTAVAGAHVDLYNTQNALINASEADGEGRYESKDLESGSYILKVTASGYEPQVATVYVKEKRNTELQLTLRSGSGRQGAPIQSALEEVGASWIKNLGKPKPAESTTENK